MYRQLHPRLTSSFNGVQQIIYIQIPMLFYRKEHYSNVKF